MTEMPTVLKICQFHELIKARRDVLGMRKCAQDIGISHATLSRLESGRLPDILTFKKMREWLGVDADYLLQIMCFEGTEG